jgi:hypothetical protein
MKIHQLLSGVNISLSNEETHFVESHEHDIRLTSLDDHDQWVAQNLVRKGVFSLSNDSSMLIRNLHEKPNRRVT